MDPMTPVDRAELEELRDKLTQPTETPAQAQPVAVEASLAPTPEPAKPAEVKPMTLDEMRRFDPTKDVVLDLEARIGTLETDLHTAQRDRGRARTEASDAKQLHERYQRAIREAVTELVAGGCTIAIPDELVRDPKLLPQLIRRVARISREITPDRDALRREVARLNGEALQHPKTLAAKDAEILQLRKDREAGVRREQQLEATAVQIQKGRDEAVTELGRSLKEQGRLEEQLAHAQATITTLRAEISTAKQREMTAKLQTTAKTGGTKA